MPQITLWSRDRAVGFPGEAAGAERVAVTYSTTMIPPRAVLLPSDSYRPATREELVGNPRVLFYPKDKAAQDAELAAIGEDLRHVQQTAPPTLEVP